MGRVWMTPTLTRWCRAMRRTGPVDVLDMWEAMCSIEESQRCLFWLAIGHCQA